MFWRRKTIDPIPCEHCGTMPTMHHVRHYRNNAPCREAFYIQCRVCHAQTAIYAYEQDSIRAWNKQQERDR